MEAITSSRVLSMGTHSTQRVAYPLFRSAAGLKRSSLYASGTLTSSLAWAHAPARRGLG